MGHHLRILVALVIATVGQSGALQAQEASPDAFRRRLDALYQAIAQGDTAALGLQLSDDLRWVVGATGNEVTKSQLLSAAAHVQNPAPRFDVDSVRSHTIGAVALVEYIRSDHRSVGAAELITRWRAFAVFAPHEGTWRLVRHTLTWLAVPLAPITLDSVALQPFVGRYQIAPGYVDDVHWETGSLVATASGQSTGARLIPVSTSAFSPDGVGAMIVFERDATGHVLGYVQGYPDGRIVRAPRLP